jgi:hypothetical protein
MKGRNVLIRVTGYVEDIYGTRIIEEVNRGNYNEAVRFIIDHPHQNITWKIRPVINDILM